MKMTKKQTREQTREQPGNDIFFFRNYFNPLWRNCFIPRRRKGLGWAVDELKGDWDEQWMPILRPLPQTLAHERGGASVQANRRSPHSAGTHGLTSDALSWNSYKFERMGWNSYKFFMIWFATSLLHENFMILLLACYCSILLLACYMKFSCFCY